MKVKIRWWISVHSINSRRCRKIIIKTRTRQTRKISIVGYDVFQIELRMFSMIVIWCRVRILWSKYRRYIWTITTIELYLSIDKHFQTICTFLFGWLLPNNPFLMIYCINLDSMISEENLQQGQFSYETLPPFNCWIFTEFRLTHDEVLIIKLKTFLQKHAKHAYCRFYQYCENAWFRSNILTSCLSVNIFWLVNMADWTSVYYVL